MRVFPINTCGRHESSNTRTTTKTPTHLDFTASTAASPRLFHLVHRRAFTIGRVGLQNPHPQQSCTGRGRIRILVSDLHGARFVKFFTTARLSLHQSRVEGHRLHRELHQVDRRLHLIIVVKEPQVTYGYFSRIMAYIFNMLIYVGMILLDNLLQCLFFIVMIDPSRTCGTAANLICYALVMIIIYSWLKIKLKVLIYPIIQKPYCMNFSLWLDLLML
jgi:hypothetical protein